MESQNNATKVRVINKSNNPLPKYETAESAGMDVRAYLPEGPVTLPIGGRVLIPTGLYIQLPHGYECQVRPRSGLALKHGITVLNSPGTVDADYRGEIGIILINHGDKEFTISSGDRVAQLVFKQYTQTAWEETTELDATERGDGAYSHTGIN